MDRPTGYENENRNAEGDMDRDVGRGKGRISEGREQDGRC